MGTGSLYDIMQKVVSKHGIIAGLVPRVAKIAPACAIMISSYKAFKKYFTHGYSIHLLVELSLIVEGFTPILI